MVAKPKSSRDADGSYIGRALGMMFLLLGACLIAFGGGVLFEIISSAFNAGREVIAVDIWRLIR